MGRALKARLSARPALASLTSITSLTSLKGSPLLRARVAVSRLGAARVAVLAVLLGSLAAAAALGLALTGDDASSVVAPVTGKARPKASAVAPVDAHLLAFFETLGNRRQNDLHIKLLFDLAKENGLTLKQGEYQYGYDNAAHIATCQIVLPLKGNYDAIWHFVLEVLKTLPFAALQDINFKRDAIGDAAVSAQVRFTLYLRDTPVRAQ